MLTKPAFQWSVGRGALLIVLLTAFGLRLWDMNEPSIWHDEGWSIRAIRDPVSTPDDNTPPAYYAVMHVLWRGAGESPLALRYGSVLLDVLTVALAARLVGRSAGPGAALVAAALLAVMPLSWAYAREIRAYIAVPLLTVILLLLANRLLAQRARVAWRVWAALLGAELLLLYTHNLSVPVVGWLNITVGSVLLWRRDWRGLGAWLGGQAALMVAYLPWLLGQSPSGTAINTPPSVSLSLLWDIWQGYFAPLPAMVGAENALVTASGVFGAVLLLSVGAILAWWRSRFALLVLSQAVLLPLLATAELIAANIDFHPRYYVAGVPAAVMLVALGMASVRPPALKRLALPAALVVGLMPGWIGIDHLLHTGRYQRDDFRAVAEYYASLADDALIVIPYGWEPALDVYYADRFGIQAEMVGIELHSDVETAVSAINAAVAGRAEPVHVELLDWFQLPADLRGMYPCVLEAAGQRSGERVVQGIATTAYRIERPVSFAVRHMPPTSNSNAALAGVSVTGQATLCVQTVWQMERAVDADWRVSMRLLTSDPSGWTLTQSDTDLRSDEQEPTSAVQDGAMVSAFSTLRLPAGAPPGDYVLRAVVFSDENASGFDWAVDGVPAGRFVQVGTLALAGNTRQAFAEVPMMQFDLAVDDVITLHGLDASADVLSAGQELRISLYWTAENCCQDQPWTDAMLTLQGDVWANAQSVAIFGPYSRDWHAFRVPADASGSAELVLDRSGVRPITLAKFAVDQTDRLYAPPAFDVPTGDTFGTLAVLEGFSVAQTTLSTQDTLDLTLVWRALEPADTSYRVFTHLLDNENHVIAQHDDFPLGGTRPTTGWMAGEYLVDRYTLVFDPAYSDYSGAARLEVGFYDPETGVRVFAVHGVDHIVLPVEIMVQ